jgi:hypothetical protein
MSYFQVCAVWTNDGDQELTMHFFDAENEIVAMQKTIDEIAHRVAGDEGFEAGEWDTCETEKHSEYFCEWYVDELITLDTLKNREGSPYSEMFAHDKFRGAQEIWVGAETAL